MNKNKIILVGLLATCFCIGCVTETNKYSFDELNSMMQADIYQCESQEVSMFYRYHLPANPINAPIVVFLHGAAGNGYDNKLSIKDSGFGNLSYYAFNTANAITVVPQCPYGTWWPSNEMVEVLSEFIQDCAKKFGADENRIYITGYSMGGIGTWKLIQAYPNMFAAAIPICGGPLSEWEYEDPEVIDDLKKLNIWAFNSINDSVIQNIYSKNVMSKLWTDETTNAHYTESFNGHTDNWVYSNTSFMNWFFSQKKSH